MHFDVDKNTIFIGMGGSHAYGMATEYSDVDIKGVCITPRSVRDSFYLNFEQFESRKQQGSWGNIADKAIKSIKSHKTGAICYQNDEEIVDLVIYSLTKFVKLATNANPNILELLFLDDEDILYENSAWKELRRHRSLFLSKKCRHTYMGYAHSQLKRIKRHRAWLLDPPKSRPKREDFGLPSENAIPQYMREQIESHIDKNISKWMLEDSLDGEISGSCLDELRERLRKFYCDLLKCDDERLLDKMFVVAAEGIDISNDALQYIRAEKLYREAKRHYKNYLRWKEERNQERAKLEEKYGLDTKHASHLIRLMRTGVEVIRDGVLQVKRKDADELLAIRNGSYTYEEIIAESEKLEALAAKLAETSPLQKSPDISKIDGIMQKILHDHDLLEEIKAQKP